MAFFETFMFCLSWFNTSITVIMSLSPVVLFVKIIQGKEKYTIVPETMLITSIGNNVGWGCYWYRMGEPVPMICSIICGSLYIIFTIIYLFYMADKKFLKALLYIFLALDVIFQQFICFLKVIKSLKVVGGILMVVNVLMYFAPAQNIVKVIKERNHKLIPIATTFLGAICSGGWLTFGLIKRDINCAVPNCLGCISSIITCCVWAYFYSKAPKEEDKGELKVSDDKEEKLEA